MSPAAEFDELLRRVSAWPVPQRLRFAESVLRSMQGGEESAAPRNTLAAARGLARGDGPPPTDDQVRQTIDEHRTEKYGT